MRFRLRPTDTTFYDLFSRSADNLTDGARLLAEMLGEGVEDDVAVLAVRIAPEA